MSRRKQSTDEENKESTPAKQNTAFEDVTNTDKNTGSDVSKKVGINDNCDERNNADITKDIDLSFDEDFENLPIIDEGVVDIQNMSLDDSMITGDDDSMANDGKDAFKDVVDDCSTKHTTNTAKSAELDDIDIYADL